MACDCASNCAAGLFYRGRSAAMKLDPLELGCDSPHAKLISRFHLVRDEE